MTKSCIWEVELMCSTNVFWNKSSVRIDTYSKKAFKMFRLI
jgi:hypothetical protein